MVKQGVEEHRGRARAIVRDIQLLHGVEGWSGPGPEVQMLQGGEALERHGEALGALGADFVLAAGKDQFRGMLDAGVPGAVPPCPNRIPPLAARQLRAGT